MGGCTPNRPRGLCCRPRVLLSGNKVACPAAAALVGQPGETLSLSSLSSTKIIKKKPKWQAFHRK